MKFSKGQTVFRVVVESPLGGQIATKIKKGTVKSCGKKQLKVDFDNEWKISVSVIRNGKITLTNRKNGNTIDVFHSTMESAIAAKELFNK